MKNYCRVMLGRGSMYAEECLSGELYRGRVKINAFQISKIELNQPITLLIHLGVVKGRCPSLRACGGPSSGRSNLRTRATRLIDSEQCARFSGPWARSASSGGLQPGGSGSGKGDEGTLFERHWD